MTESERRDAPWPYYTQKAAARRLGVDFELLSGLSGHTQKGGRRTLRAIKSATSSGNWITLYNRDDIDALANILAQS